MSFFVVVMTTWQDHVNHQLHIFVALAITRVVLYLIPLARAKRRRFLGTISDQNKFFNFNTVIIRKDSSYKQILSPNILSLNKHRPILCLFFPLI